MFSKKQIQQRVLQNGKPLSLDKFSWDEKTNTFSSNEEYLVLDFAGISSCTFNTGCNCTFNTLSDCTFKTGSNCTFKTGSNCTFETGSNCTFKTWSDCTFKTGSNCTFKTGSNCTFKTGSNCTFKTWSDCTFKTGSNCTFKTGSNCTFKTWSDCTFKTGSNCTFNVLSDCTFNVLSDCTFNVLSDCTFNTGYNCFVLRRDTSEMIILKEGDEIQLCPYNIKGFLINGKLNGEPHIIADNILSKIVNKKGNIYKVINHNETKQSYLIEQKVSGKIYYSHGKTLKEARESIIFKISDRDLTKWKHLKSSDKITFEESIQLYRDITGACSEGTKYFVDKNKDKKKKNYSIKELIKLTKGQYGSEIFIKYFEGK